MSVKVIAIDGPAASGKSTIARMFSERLHIPYINTGNMYRAITWVALRNGLDLTSPEENQMRLLLGDLELAYELTERGKYELKVNGVFPEEEIRSPEVVAYVSQVAATPCVREWLMEKQRSLAALGLLVMEGRDIGTVIFPDAQYKYFLTASPLVRAQRRLAQSGENVEGATVESVARDIAQRDEIDSQRAIAPLKQAEDAVLVDSSDMTIDEVLDFMLKYIDPADIEKVANG
jgi:cytidylate kinase